MVVAIDREDGTAVGRVDAESTRTAYVATGDGVVTTDPDSLETCHVLCTRYFCTIPPTGWGIEFRAVDVDGGPGGCVPMDLTWECTPNFPWRRSRSGPEPRNTRHRPSIRGVFVKGLPEWLPTGVPSGLR